MTELDSVMQTIDHRYRLAASGLVLSEVRYAYLRHARVGHVEAARYRKADEDEAR